MRRHCFPGLAVIGLLSVVPFAFAQDASGPPSASPGATAGSLAVVLDAQGSTVVVTDAAQSSLAVYKIEGSQIRLVGVRNLARDFQGEPAKASASAPLPQTDVPGVDPPSLERPPKSVRLSSDYLGDFAPHEQWTASYVAVGTTAEVYEKLRSAFKSWSLIGQRSDPSGTAGFKVTQDRSTVEVGVSPTRDAPDRVLVQVTERRKRS